MNASLRSLAPTLRVASSWVAALAAGFILMFNAVAADPQPAKPPAKPKTAPPQLEPRELDELLENLELLQHYQLLKRLDFFKDLDLFDNLTSTPAPAPDAPKQIKK